MGKKDLIEFLRFIGDDHNTKDVREDIRVYQERARAMLAAAELIPAPAKPTDIQRVLAFLRRIAQAHSTKDIREDAEDLQDTAIELGAEPAVELPLEGIALRALQLYQAPFRYDAGGGYVWDGRANMVADATIPAPAQVARIRGWGRIGYMDDPHRLQDAVGELVATALTEFWAKHR